MDKSGMVGIQVLAVIKKSAFMEKLDYLIRLEEIKFEKLQDGLEQKRVSKDNKVLRILKINHTFTEANWCTKGHVGYVLRGKMKIDFNGQIREYIQGDGLWIEKGENSKHKVTIDKGEEVQLILFETIE
jgi:hypothetical protein